MQEQIDYTPKHALSSQLIYKYICLENLRMGCCVELIIVEVADDINSVFFQVWDYNQSFGQWFYAFIVKPLP